MIEEINGNLITLAKEGKFDVIGQGCNCFCTMKRGIAPQMAAAFGCDKFRLEQLEYKGDINKLGCIDYEQIVLGTDGTSDIFVVNMYTQYHWHENSPFSDVPLSYEALEMCFLKVNQLFKGKKIGLPWIGCGLAGGDRKDVRLSMEVFLRDCHVTIVNYESKRTIQHLKNNLRK